MKESRSRGGGSSGRGNSREKRSRGEEGDSEDKENQCEGGREVRMSREKIRGGARSGTRGEMDSTRVVIPGG